MLNTGILSISPIYTIRWLVAMHGERATRQLAEGGQEALSPAMYPLDSSVFIRVMCTEADFTPSRFLEWVLAWILEVCDSGQFLFTKNPHILLHLRTSTLWDSSCCLTSFASSLPGMQNSTSDRSWTELEGSRKRNLRLICLAVSICQRHLFLLSAGCGTRMTCQVTSTNLGLPWPVPKKCSPCLGFRALTASLSFHLQFAARSGKQDTMSSGCISFQLCPWLGVSFISSNSLETLEDRMLDDAKEYRIGKEKETLHLKIQSSQASVPVV